MKLILDRIDEEIPQIRYYKVSKLCEAGCDIFKIGEEIVGPLDFPFYKKIEKQPLLLTGINDNVKAKVRVHIIVNYCGKCGETL